MAANSQTVSWNNQASAQTVQSSAPYSDTIVIANNTDVTVFARADGTAATNGGAGCLAVEAGQELTIENGQQLPDEDLKPNNSQGVPNTSTYEDISTVPGWTVQQGYQSTTLYSAAPNIVSLFPASTTNAGTITVSFQ